ncbi:hypothetical protein JD844_017787 [Phrynosoma platyrhinos]|uniref:Uncharacterized protein n=1 Tax=Phrynosoma platyrhinos TaxID=52577 RepID=A0ABQ7SMB7_PHRPL|nr:hypothetical protein JD844_017787 [Phrynosoma platyrhinos]
MHKLTQLERLDLGNNEFSELPEVLEQIQNLKELWMDNNSLQTLPGPIGRLKQLVYLDVSKNRIESIDMDISGCEALEDLLLSSNMLQQLPDSIEKYLNDTEVQDIGSNSEGDIKYFIPLIWKDSLTHCFHHRIKGHELYSYGVAAPLEASQIC